MNEAVYDRRAANVHTFQAAHRLITKNGGGVVYPKGFYGPGFYLPEWEFIRYCAKADHQEQQAEPESWWKRHMMKPSWIGLVIWVIAINVVSAITKQMFGSGAPLAALMTYIAFVFYRAVVHNFHVEPQNLAEAYPSAIRLSVFSHWSHHILAAMIARKDTSCLGLVLQSAMMVFVVFVVHSAVARGDVHFAFALGLAPFFLVQVGYPMIILASVVWTYARLRRFPTAADLHPIDEPRPQPA